MANNATPQAIAVANNEFRPVNDAICTAILSMQAFLAKWSSGNLIAIIPNDSNPIQDGSTTASGSGAGSGADGRPPITDGTVNVAVSNMTTLMATFNANSALLFNQFMVANVNGKSVI